MRQGRRVALRVVETLEGRHLHVVGAFGIEGARAAVADTRGFSTSPMAGRQFGRPLAVRMENRRPCFERRERPGTVPDIVVNGA